MRVYVVLVAHYKDIGGEWVHIYIQGHPQSS